METLHRDNRTSNGAHPRNVWSLVERRLALLFIASSVAQAEREACLLALRLRERHGEVPLEAAMRLALAEAESAITNRDDGDAAIGRKTPEAAPLLIRTQTIEPVTSALRVRPVTAFLASLVPALGFR